MRSILWRIWAVLALILYALLVFLAIWIVVHNVLFALLLGVTAASLLYAGWLVFTGSGGRERKGRWYLALGLFALLLELVYFIRHISDLVSVVIVIGITAAYLALAEMLRRKYWRDKRHAGEMRAATAKFHRPYLIINPKAGNGRATKAHIAELAAAQGIRVLTLTKGDDVEAVARQAAEEGADVLGISGGDGSIGAVAKVALEHDLPMVVLPGGTRCHFARDLGLDPKRITDALVGFNGIMRRIDIGTINDRIFLNNASFGLYADIVDSPEYREHKLQVTRNVLRSLVNGKQDPYDLDFHHGKQHFRKAVEVLIGVNSYQTMNLFELGRRAKLDAGVLQITAVLRLSDETVKRMAKNISLSAVHGSAEHADIEQWEAKRFDITNHLHWVVVGVDGERERYETPVTVRIMPKALRVYVPPEGERNRPKHALSLFAAKHLWRAGA